MKRRRLTLLPEPKVEFSGSSTTRRSSLPPTPKVELQLQPLTSSQLQRQWSRVGDGFQMDSDHFNIGFSTALQRQKKKQPLRQQKGQENLVQWTTPDAMLNKQNDLESQVVQKPDNQKRLKDLEARYEQLKRMQRQMDQPSGKSPGPDCAQANPYNQLTEQPNQQHTVNNRQEDQLKQTELYEQRLQNRHEDQLQSQNRHEDQLQRQNRHEDRQQRQNSHKDQLQRQNSHEDQLQRQNSHEDRQQRQNSHEDQLQRQNSHEDRQQRQNSHEDQLQRQNSHEDQLQRQSDNEKKRSRHDGETEQHRQVRQDGIPKQPQPRRRLSLVLPPKPVAVAQSSFTSSASSSSKSTSSLRRQSKPSSGDTKRRRSCTSAATFRIAIGEDSDALALAVDTDSSSSPTRQSPPTTPPKLQTAINTTPVAAANSSLALAIESTSTATTTAATGEDNPDPAAEVKPPTKRRRLCLVIDEDDDDEDSGAFGDYSDFGDLSVFDSGGGGKKSRRRRTNLTNSLADRSTTLARLRINSAHLWRHAVDSIPGNEHKLEKFVRLRICQRVIDHGMLRIQCRIVEDPHRLIDLPEGITDVNRESLVCHAFLAGRSGVPLSRDLIGKRKKKIPPVMDLLVAKPFRLVPVESSGEIRAVCLTEIRRMLCAPMYDIAVEPGATCGCGNKNAQCPAALAKLSDDWLSIQCFKSVTQPDQQHRQFDSTDVAKQPTPIRLLVLALGKYSYWPADGHGLTNRILALTSSAAFIWLRVRAADYRALPVGYVLSVNSRQELVQLNCNDTDPGVISQFDFCRLMQRALVTKCQLQLAQFLQQNWHSLQLESLDCRFGRLCVYSSRALLKPPQPPVYSVGYSTPAPSRCSLHGLLLRILYDCPMRLYIYCSASNQVVCTRATDNFYLSCDAKEGCIVDIADCLVIKGALYCDRFSSLSVMQFADADLAAFEYVQPSSEQACKVGQLLELPPTSVTIVHKDDAYAWPVCPICFACRVELANPPAAAAAAADNKRVCGRCGSACQQPLITRRLEVTVQCQEADNPLASLEFRLLLHPDTAAGILEDLQTNCSEDLIGYCLDSRLAFVSRCLGEKRYQMIEASFDYAAAAAAAASAAMAAAAAAAAAPTVLAGGTAVS